MPATARWKPARVRARTSASSSGPSSSVRSRARIALIASTDMWKKGRSRTSRSCSAMLDLPELDVPLRKMTCPVRIGAEFTAPLFWRGLEEVLAVAAAEEEGEAVQVGAESVQAAGRWASGGRKERPGVAQLIDLCDIAPRWNIGPVATGPMFHRAGGGHPPAGGSPPAGRVRRWRGAS